MSTMYLIRHGITEGNQRRLYYGKTDLPLIEEGKRAIRERAEAGIYPAAEGLSFVTSGLLRTKETLFEIYGTVSHIADERLNEIDFGDFEMKSYEELKDREDYQKWIFGDTWANVCPNGESGAQMDSRAFPALKGYADKDVFIVCHGGIISSWMQSLFPDDNEHRNFYEWTPKPCEGYVITFENGKAKNYQKVTI